VSRLSLRLRSAALLLAAAFAVHDGRYALAPDGAESASAHGYLALAAPLVAFALALAGGCFLAVLAVAGRAGPPAAAPAGRLWGPATGLLVLTFLGQEWAEGLLSAGRPDAPLAALTGGGWVALVLAPAAGLLVALVLRGADSALRRAAARPLLLRARPGPAPLLSRARPAAVRAVALLCGSVAGRAPPRAPV